jgi:energy-coupling factor transporter ATP-binding protein EcfA2
MQIHYIWVNNYSRLQKAGINLSARLIVEMTIPKEPGEPYVLTIDENPEYINNFFKKDNILNVSAIIGKNGAGKTTILNYIKHNLPAGRGVIVRDDVFIYSTRGVRGDEQFTILKPASMQVNLVHNTTIQFDEQFYGGNADNSFKLKTGLGDAEYIYYSYLLNFEEDLQPWRGLTNISTSFLMMEERRRLLEENAEEGTKTRLLSRNNDLDNLHFSEVQREIQFLISNRPIPFERPDSLHIEIDLNDLLYFMDQPSNHPDILNLLTKFQQEINVATAPTVQLTGNFLLAIFTNYLINDYKYTIGTGYLHEITPVGDRSAREYILDYFTSMANLKINHEGMSVELPRQQELSVLVPRLVAILEQLIGLGFVEVLSGTAVQLRINENGYQIFMEFAHLYFQVKGISSFLKFRWRNLSGGEQSYLSLMSRFYYVRHHRIGDLPRNLVILIDEGDIGYHPEWQRKFLNETIEFLSELFSDHQLQLIITANTPFLSSDLPKAHVLFVEWINKKESIFHSKINNREPTFGANIHTLLSDSFYMDGILMGEFARKRINDIIEYINTADENDTPDAVYRKTIDLIGEPVLRNKLQDMWMEKFKLPEELRMLEQRMKEINRLMDIQKEEKTKKSKKK